MLLVLEAWLDDKGTNRKAPWQYRIRVRPRLTIYGYSTATDAINIGVKRGKTLPHTQDAHDIYAQLVSGVSDAKPFACVAAIQLMQEYIGKDRYR